MNDPFTTDTDLIEYILSIQNMGEGDGKSRETGSVSGQFLHFVDEMPGGFFIYHAYGGEELIYANKSMLRIFDCDTMAQFRELTGNSFRGIVHPEDLEAVEESIWRQIRDSQYDLDYVEYRIITRRGEIRWVDDYGHFIHSETAGDVFYVFAGDSTERKRLQREAESQAAEERRQYMDLLEGLSIGYESILYVDLEQDRVQAYRLNDRTRKQFAKELEVRRYSEFAPDYVSTWVHPEDREYVARSTASDDIRRQLAADRTFYVNFRVVKDGSTRYVQLRIVNVGESGSVSKIVMGYQNMDAEIVREIERQQLLKNALESANTAIVAKNAFLANMSHDVRTPMNAIMGFTDLARKHCQDGGKLKYYLDRIEAVGDQLLSLLNGVLEISKIESGNLHIENARCSLTETLQEVRTRAMSRAGAKNITLTLDLSGMEHDIVYSDGAKIGHILSRIVSNGVKYTKENGQVSVFVREERADCADCAVYHFIVQDNGIGIAEDMLARIFQPFEREKNTTQSGVHGTGLGLTIAKSIAEAMGGTVEVVSEVGKGSTFTVTLRLCLRDTQKGISSAKKKKPAPTEGKKRVLIVEDTEINLEIETELLRDAGYLVDVAADGSVAVEKVRNSQPGYYDLILMDIQMPIMDGYRATEEIRSLGDPVLSNIPIVALSANAFDEDKKKSRESGMNAHMEKPIDTPRLMNVISSMLEEGNTELETETCSTPDRSGGTLQS